MAYTYLNIMRSCVLFVLRTAGVAAAAVVVCVALMCTMPTVAAGDGSGDVVVSSTCDPRGIPQGSAFWGHLGFLLEELVANAPYTPHYSFKTRVGGGDAPAFGEAYCQASCSSTRCEACLRQLSTNIWGVCNNALGARVEYPDCWIHYECFYF